MSFKTNNKAFSLPAKKEKKKEKKDLTKHEYINKGLNKFLYVS